MRLNASILACLIAGALLAGCGSSNDKSSSSSSTSTTSTSSKPASSGGGKVAVGMKGLRFHPATITAKVGQTIVWTNGEAIPHNVTAKAGAKFKSSTLNQGAKFTYKPTKPGKISYVCTFHPGMEGTITVTR